MQQSEHLNEKLLNKIQKYTPKGKRVDGESQTSTIAIDDLKTLINGLKQKLKSLKTTTFAQSPTATQEE